MSFRYALLILDAIKDSVLIDQSEERILQID